MSTKTPTVLVVEDESSIASFVALYLKNAGYEVTTAATGSEALARVAASEVALIILDLMLPGLDGYRVLKALRAEGMSAPVLILTARAEEADKVRGFRMGADDYVTKPFGVMELLARVEALLRRAGTGNRESDLSERLGDVEIDRASRSVTRAKAPVELTPMEFDLLVALVRRRGAVASRIELLQEVWGYGTGVVSRTVDTHVAELRRKIEEDPARPKHILTVRKAGYRVGG